MHANVEAEVGDRPVPEEPMYILLNLAISTAFGAIDYDGLEPLWPQVMTWREDIGGQPCSLMGRDGGGASGLTRRR